MKIQVGKTYLTAGEYVVEIMEDKDQLHATRRTSAGQCGGKGIDKCWNKPYGWYYNDDGLITGISKEWDKKLTITEELPFSLPELPKRYEWAGGFPQYRVPNVGEYFCAKNTSGTLTGEVGECLGIAGLFGSDKRRLIVSKAALTEPQKSESPVEPSVVSEKPPIDVGEGYRLINKDIDQPHEDDQIYNEYIHKWQKRDSTFINEPYARVSIYRRALPTAALSEPQRKLIPFNGAGQYRLNNGKIVNLNDSRCCKYEDGIMSTSGNVLNWSWNKDGSINGPFADLEGLSLAEKMAALSEPQRSESPVESSVVPKELPPLPILNSSDGYKFLLSSGEPVFRKPNDGDYFVKYNYATKKYGPIVKSKNFSVPWGVDERRYIVVPSEQEKIPVVPQEQPIATAVANNSIGWNISNGKTYNVYDIGLTSLKIKDDAGNIQYYSKIHFGSIIAANNSETPKESEDWVEITDLDHVDRAHIDQWTLDGVRWIPTIDITDKMSLRKCRERFGENAKYRCLRKHQVVPAEQQVDKSSGVPNKHPKRLVSKVTNNFLTKGESYEVFGDYKPNMTAYKVKVSGGYLSFWSDCFESDISLSDNIVSGADSTKEEEKIIMKKETAIKVANSVTRFAGRWGFKAANYWLFEPVKEVASKIMRSVRYVFLGSALVGGIYAYNDPQAAKDFFWDCIPSISISFEAPEILNG